MKIFYFRCGPLRCLAVVLLGAILTTAHAADPSPTGKHFLWRVTNAPAPFYLLGSLHAMRRTDYPLAKVIDDAIDQSQQFWFEVDPRRGDLFSKKLRAAAHYPSGVHIKDKVNPKTYAYLLKITRSGWSQWQDLKPWAIGEFLMSHPGFIGMSGDYGIESHVVDRARRHNRPVGGIESIDEHVRVFSDMQDIEGEVFLLQTLVHIDQDAAQLPQEIAAWKAGDAEHFYALRLPEIKEAPTVWWRLLDRRNARWIPRIETEIKSRKPTMIVAGALHFCGPHGVIALLEKRGYKIEQL